MKRMHVQNSSPDSALQTRTLQRICAPEHIIETPVTLFKSALQMSVSRGTAVFNRHADVLSQRSCTWLLVLRIPLA
jgi:hypothetical protein